VLGVASEHDEVAGTERGANTLFVSTLAGRRVTHLGDLGQRALRDEQLSALGTVDLLFVPVGGGPTIGAQQATEIGAAVGAIVPMHYKTTASTSSDQSVFGEVTVRRLAYRRRGQENLYLADGVLNPPAERASHGVRRLAAIESSRGSFDDGTDQVPRTDRAFDR
jgi:L-ascorbate metabolism protein UlaG (beta-lactamase superfamily)